MNMIKMLRVLIGWWSMGDEQCVLAMDGAEGQRPMIDG